MRTFICNIPPNELLTKLNAPQAPNNFCQNLFNGNIFERIHSIVPISYWYKPIQIEDNIKYYNGYPKPNRFIKILQYIYLNIRCALNSRRSDSIWFYNICKANLICFMILRFIFFKKVFVILLDYTPSNNPFNIQFYIPYLYKKVNGVISLSQRTDIINHNVGYKAGIIPIQYNKETNLFNKNKKLRFLFSGNLSHHTGLLLAIDTFKDLPDIELYLCGLGNIDNAKITPHKNIHYLGYLNYEEYLKLYEKIDVCLSLRDPQYEENNYNFPSKILEYFSYRKIVISTIKYPELTEFKYFHCNYNQKSLTKTILEITNSNYNELNKYTDNINALNNNFSINSWKKMILQIEKS